jgi:hypothetical protein
MREPAVLLKLAGLKTVAAQPGGRHRIFAALKTLLSEASGGLLVTFSALFQLSIRYAIR